MEYNAYLLDKFRKTVYLLLYVLINFNQSLPLTAQSLKGKIEQFISEIHVSSRPILFSEAMPFLPAVILDENRHLVIKYRAGLDL